MPTTSNFGWTTPADTDLVKDGAAAIRTLGNGIDTSFLDLKGGTTDQVLAKNSNTDLDFKWVAQDDANAIQNTIIDAKGDLIVGSAADTPARLAVGTNGHILVAKSSEATGLAWEAPVTGGMTLIETLTLTGSGSVTSSSIAGTYKHILAVTKGLTASGAGIDFYMRLNGDSGTNYVSGAIINNNASLSGRLPAAENKIVVSDLPQNTQTGDLQMLCSNFWIYRYTDTAQTFFEGDSIYVGNTRNSWHINGFYDNSAAITTITFLTSSGTFNTGTAYIYGVS